MGTFSFKHKNGFGLKYSGTSYYVYLQEYIVCTFMAAKTWPDGVIKPEDDKPNIFDCENFQGLSSRIYTLTACCTFVLSYFNDILSVSDFNIILTYLLHSAESFLRS